jgi:hypothetical protein
VVDEPGERSVGAGVDAAAVAEHERVGRRRSAHPPSVRDALAEELDDEVASVQGLAGAEAVAHAGGLVVDADLREPRRQGALEHGPRPGGPVVRAVRDVLR